MAAGVEEIRDGCDGCECICCDTAMAIVMATRFMQTTISRMRTDADDLFEVGGCWMAVVAVLRVITH